MKNLSTMISKNMNSILIILSIVLIFLIFKDKILEGEDSTLEGLKKKKKRKKKFRKKINKKLRKIAKNTNNASIVGTGTHHNSLPPTHPYGQPYTQPYTNTDVQPHPDDTSHY